METDQSALCQECHTGVRDELAARNGTHGRLKEVGKCASCHAEHRGRDFDPAQTALDHFNHNLTPFPLSGQHAQAACADCHKDGRYGGTQAACSACHAEPEIHAGVFGLDCAKCHSDQSWKPGRIDGLVFDHSRANFSLARHQTGYDGRPLVCKDCHGPQSEHFDQQACVDCHTAHPPAAQPDALDFLARHTETYGADCLQCHDGGDRMNGFNHAQVFALDGKHAGLECESCHAGKKFRGTSTRCSSCHTEPEIHAGYFGLQCDYCHTAEAWQPAMLRAHNFPLEHGAPTGSTCETCHTDRYTEFTCYGCHDHTQDDIRRSHAKVDLPPGITLDQCAACHPAGE